jgi:hypothetical protein
LKEIPSCSIDSFKLFFFAIDSENIKESGKQPCPKEKEEHKGNTINYTLGHQVFKLS